jgi:hypothetical protein
MEIRLEDIKSELKYFGRLSEKQRTALLEKYPGATLALLENQISAYYAWFWYYRVHHALSMSTNFLYFFFQINTSNEGVKEFIEVAFGIEHVSDAVGYGVGVPFAILDILFFSSTFSTDVAALHDTLAYIHRKPIQERLIHYVRTLKENPKSSMLDLGSQLIHQPILWMSNLTSVMSEVNEYRPFLNKLPTYLKFSFIGTVLYFANSYMVNFMNANYYDGVKFWRNHKPWLIGEVLRGNIATPLQIVIQSFSAMTPRSFPYYYYIATASKETMGWWPPAALVAMVAFIHSIFVLYPVTYDFYMSDEYQAKKIMSELFAEDVNKLMLAVKAIMGTLDTDFEEEINQCNTDYIYKRLTANSEVNVIKEAPFSIPILLFRLFIGGYFGDACIKLLSDSAANSIPARLLGMALGALLFVSLLYKAELNRVKAEHVFKEINPQKQPSVDELMHRTLRGKIIHAAADTVNIGSGLSFALSSMGTLSRLTESHSPLILTAVAIIVVEQMLNGILFGTNKVRTTLWNIFSKPMPQKEQDIGLKERFIL